MMKCKQFAVLLLWLLTILSVSGEGFEKLRETQANAQQLKANNWTCSSPVMLPRGWYLTPFMKNGKFKIVKNAKVSFKGQQCIFLHGDAMMDSTLLRRKANDDIVEVVLHAKSNIPSATVRFNVNLWDQTGQFLGSVTKYAKVTPEWKQYSIKVKIPVTVRNKTVFRVAPSIGSAQGAYFDEIEFYSLNSANVISAKAGEKKVVIRKLLMDFDFTNVDGKKEIDDKTGNYTLFSDCGNLLGEADALRVAFGARLRIPCANRAFGENFTISVWLVKSGNLGRHERTPILCRGFMRPYGKPIPGRGKFDFALATNCYLPEFKTIFGGLTTRGVPYNQTYAYNQLKWQKKSPKGIFKFDRYMHIAAVYECGATRLYLNGQLVAENPQKSKEALMTSGQPLYLGAFRVENESDNQLASEMLIKSLKVESGVLTDSEVNAMYNAEKVNIPTDKKYVLTHTRNYYPKEMLPNDPQMKSRLKITSKYLKEHPTDPYKNKLNMTAAYRGSPRDTRLFVNNISVPPVMTCAHMWDRREYVHDEFCTDFTAAGVNAYRVGLLPGQIWKGDGKYDFSLLDDRIRRVISINPKVRVNITISLSPPKWFHKKYPEEFEVYYANLNDPLAGMKKWTGHGGLLGSDLWLKKSCLMLQKMAEHLENGPYKNHIWGYSVGGGEAGEWYWPGQFTGGMTGYSIPTRNNFRKYLKKKYQNSNQLLQKAWQDKKVTFDTAEVPSPKERTATENGLFRNPEVARKCNDFRKFINARTLLNVNESCRILRKIVGKEKIITTYYGYSLFYAGRGLLHVSGLQGVSDVLKSPYIDSIATPLDYYRRRGSEPGVNIAGFTGTAQLNKKMIWREEDLRTHLFPRLIFGRTSTLRETLAVISRDYGYTMAENYGMWYVCQGEMHGWHQNEIMEHIAQMQKIVKVAATKKRVDTAEVALIFDEKDSLTCLAGAYNSLVVNHIWGVYQKAHSMGAPFKLYFLDDLARADMPDYKLYIFLNPWHISSEQRKMILRKIGKNNAVSVWNYAPGYMSEKGVDLENMKKLTGFEFIEKRQRRTIGTSSKSFTSHVLNSGVSPLPAESFSPYFGIKVDDSETLAKMGDITIMGVREMKSRRSVWTLLPLSVRQLTNLCDYAGVHVYGRDGNLLLANDSYILLHTAKNGKHSISLPKIKNVTEVIRNKKIGKTAQFAIDSKKGVSHIFQLD